MIIICIFSKLRAYDRAFIQFNGTEAVTHLQPRPYERSTILDVGTEGIHIFIVTE